MNLSVEELSFSYRGGAPVLRNVSFSADSGEFISVLGPNGVGKSTLFRCILGGLSSYTGRIALNGTDVRSLSRRELARHIAYIPQTHRPTFGYTVLDTVLMGTTSRLSTFQQPGREQKEAALAALELIGIARLRERNFARLSGGEQQLTLIARALAQQSDVLVMDEPTSALDYGNQLRILRQIRALTRRGYTVLLSTHNPQHALSFADRILALSDGAVAACGAPESVLTPELMRRLYRIDVSFSDTPEGRILVPRMGGDES